MTLTWQVREPPIPPVAVLGRDRVVAPLAAAVARALGRQADLRVAHAPGLLLVLGDAGSLPWVDGAVWLGRDHGLLVPTDRTVDVSGDLVAAAVERASGAAQVQVLLPDAILASDVPVGPPDPALLAELGAVR